jgi:DNA-binding transcriptional LysR family regulator
MLLLVTSPAMRKSAPRGRASADTYVMQHLDWDDLRVFGAIVRGTSVRTAAQELGIHHSTVARRLEQLEAHLRVNLFTRTPLGLRITDAGRELLDRTERVQAEIDSLERSLHGQDQRLEGAVRLTMPDAMAATFLMDDLARFAEAHPKIELELLATYDALDLGRREADMAIRVTASPPEFLVGRNLGGFALAVYASPDYLVDHDPLANPAQCSWVGIGGAAQQTDWRDVVDPAMPSQVISSNVLLRIAAVRAGVGIAMLPCALCDTDPGLVRVPGIALVQGGPIWLLTHPDLRSAARVRALMNCIAESFERNRASLLGSRTPKQVRPLARAVRS